MEVTAALLASEVRRANGILLELSLTLRVMAVKRLQLFAEIPCDFPREDSMIALMVLLVDRAIKILLTCRLLLSLQFVILISIIWIISGNRLLLMIVEKFD